MAPLSQVNLLGLVLCSFVAPSQSLRTTQKAIFSAKPPNIRCCKIIEGSLYENKGNAVSVQGAVCKQKQNRHGVQHCTAKKYPEEPHLELLKVETLKVEDCLNAPSCTDILSPKCYKIIQGELSPWYYSKDSSQQDFPLGMEVSVSGKICQKSERIHHSKTYMNGHLQRLQRFARLKIASVEMLGSEDCNVGSGEGLQEPPQCDDFGFWKQVLITEGIQSPNWKAAITKAEASNDEGMSWGTTLLDDAEEDTVWNARRDTILKTDYLLSSWS